MTQKITNLYTQKRSSHKKSMKIKKDSIIKLRHNRAKEAIKKLNNKIYNKRPVKNLKILKNLLKTK